MVQMLIKKKEIQSFWRGLNAVSQGEHHRMFAYAVGRNLQKLRPIVRLLEDETRPLEEFEKKSLELARAMAKKDESGEPVQLPGNIGLAIADPPAFNAAIKNLRESTGQDKRDEEIKELLESEEEVDIYQIDFDKVPETMKGAVLEALMPMIREPKDTEE